jgi:hypothetical protein
MLIIKLTHTDSFLYLGKNKTTRTTHPHKQPVCIQVYISTGLYKLVKANSDCRLPSISTADVNPFEYSHISQGKL